jgi:hypothetical protein
MIWSLTTSLRGMNMAERTHKMSKVPTENVTGRDSIATYRLGRVIEALRVFGECCGSQYAWEPEQIEKADQAILEAAEKAITSIKEGKQLADAGIVL